MCGFNGDVCAGRAHGDADMDWREGGRVVHAITDHNHRMSLGAFGGGTGSCGRARLAPSVCKIFYSY